MTNIEKAIKWFKIRGISAYEDDGSVYVQVNGYDDTEDVQVTTAEVDYRAELYDEMYADDEEVEDDEE